MKKILKIMRPGQDARLEQLEKIVQIQNSLSRLELDSKKMLQSVVSQAQDLTRATGAVVELIEGDELVYYSACGSALSSVGVRIPIKGSLSGLAISQNQILVCDDSETDSRVNRDACRKVKVRSMIVVPMQHKGKVFGILKTLSNQPSHFQTAEIKGLEVISGFLASCVGQAWEFEENKLLQQKAETATRAKADFLANMSHEIRTPLNGILGFAALLQEGELSPTHREYVNMLESSGQGLLAVINDILDFSKIEAKMLKFENTDFDLIRMVKIIEQNFQVQAKKKGLGFSVVTPLFSSLMVIGDENRIRQVLINLVGNAMKFTQTGTVLLKLSVVSQTHEALVMRFEVIDTGIGLSDVQIEKLFSPFTQADTSTTRKFGGTGLGLSISKQLVELMQGEISVASTMGEGSNFWFQITLPKGSAKEKPEIKQAFQRNQTPFKVLLAEDIEANQMIARKLLEMASCGVTIVSNGIEAIDILKSQDFDLVFMDCQMPELDGYEATKKIRKGIAGIRTDIPIIAITANAMTDDRKRCVESGMDDYISKPISAKSLNEVLIRWAEKLNSLPKSKQAS